MIEYLSFQLEILTPNNFIKFTCLLWRRNVMQLTNTSLLPYFFNRQTTVCLKSSVRNVLEKQNVLSRTCRYSNQQCISQIAAQVLG